MKFFSALCLTLGLCGLAQAQTAPLAQAENSFAVDLYKQLRTRPGNLFFSPYSVATGVGMVYVGAKGETAAQIAQVLHLEKLPPSSDPQAAYLADVKAQSASLAHLSERGTMFQAANAIWTSKDLTFQPAFLAKIQNDFGGSVTAVDFGDPIAASDTIDRWVMNETAHHIQNLVTPEMLEPPPGLVLTNAIYFRPVWDDPFLPEATQQEIFHVRPGHDVKTAMMNKTAGYSLDVAPGVKILTLPYHSGVYCQSGQCHTYGTSMLIILPDSATGLPRLEAGLTEAKLEKWLHDSQTAAVILKLPKFSAESDFSLKDELVKLGIKTAFKRFGADLTGIANDPEKRLYVGAVLHKAYISVDEKGAEAAAATAIVGPVAMSAPPPPPLNPPPPVPFFADHPFLYLIRDDNTGTILFMGRVENPTD